MVAAAIRIFILFLFSSLCAAQEEFPSRPIRLIVSFTPGGGADLTARAVGARKQSPLLPDVPPLAEAGGGEDTLASTYFAFALPAGTPRPET